MEKIYVRTLHSLHTEYQNNDKIVVFYHGGCADGFGAAWAVWQALGKYAKTFIAVPCAYNMGKQPIYDVLNHHGGLEGAHVYIVDFSFDAQYMADILYEHGARSLVVIDHHQTSEGKIHDLECMLMDGDEGTPNYTVVYNKENSGAVLTWEYLFPDVMVPAFLRHIEDRDLWRFSFSGTKVVCAAIYAQPFTFQRWDNYKTNSGLDQLIIEGDILLKNQAKQMELVMAPENIGTGAHEGLKFKLVNCPYFLASEVGNALMSQGGIDMAIMYTIKHADNSVQLSFRSDDEHPTANVATICEQFSGGGHANAAGCTMTLLEFLRFMNVSMVPLLS